MDIIYKRNLKNLGWAKNFINSFEMSSGKFILMLGDDDLLVDGALDLIINRLQNDDMGVLCITPYGYNESFVAERPHSKIKVSNFYNSQKYLIAVQRFFTLTSALVLNKNYLKNVDAKAFLDTDLATFHLMLRASLNAPVNTILDGYLIASKRQNSFSYKFVDVFVRQFWRIIEAQIPHGLEKGTIKKLERIRIFAYYPFYILDIRMHQRDKLENVKNIMEEYFSSSILFYFWLWPILTLYRPIALLWGFATVIIGRIYLGEWRRIIKYLQVSGKHLLYRNG